MTYKKTSLFDADLQKLADIARVMSHPARLAILRYLAQCNSCISGDISNEIPLSRTTVSQHLQELKKAGLIQGEIDGLKVNYCICGNCIDDVKHFFEGFFNEISTELKSQC
ncbi:MAG: metalloregulator ArsR/SmtB family transcription factor [Ignavibacteria bacterium]|nr:metalloregulator ArsR/SmtB family transcription factor [Ignavibacteria bacterium]